MQGDMMRSATFLILALVLLTVIPAASAALIVNKYTNDFAVQSPYAEEITACSCENRADLITVTNTGNFYSSFTASVLSEQPEWYKVSLKEFTLAPGESRTVVVYAEPSCGTIGQYDYTIKILSSFGREQLLHRSMDIRKCQNVFLTVETNVNETNLCTPVTFHLTVKNVAEFADTYHLDLGSFNDYVVYNDGGRDLFLLPNEQRTMDAVITAPCSLYGEITVPFTITSDKNKIVEQRSVSFRIINQFDHEILAPEKIEICARLPSDLSIGVKNAINVSNDYDVLITGPGYMNYDIKEFHLDGFEQKNLTLTFDPGIGDDGSEIVKVRVASKLGDIKKTKEITVGVFDCFRYSVGFVDEQQSGAGSYTDTACCGEKEYTFNIRNGGQTEETYNILVNGPSWFAPDETTIRLKPSENKNVRFVAKLPCNDQTYEIPVTVVLTKHASINETVLFTVNSQTQQTCHAVELDASRVSLDNETGVLPLFLTSTGIEGGVYHVALDAELYSEPLERIVTLEPGETQVLHLQTKQNLTDYFDGKYQSTVLLTYDSLNVTYAGQFWTDYQHLSWFTRTWRAIASYDYGAVSPCLWAMILLTILVLVALCVLLLAFLGKLVAFRASWSEQGIFILKTLLLVALLLVLLALILSPWPPKASFYEDGVNDTSGLVLQWYENERFDADLAQYFDDPDQDDMVFTSSQPAHVAVAIEDGVATLTPERNWAGNDKIVFTASDGKGGVTDSPILGLIVLQRKELTFGQWLGRYCVQINLLLLAFLLVLLLLLAFLFLTPRSQKPVPGQKSVHVLVNKDGTVRKIGEQPTPAPKAVSSSARSHAMDQALVAGTQPHEMATILKSLGKRTTKENIQKLQAAVRAFKQDQNYVHNREGFYFFLGERDVLHTLEDSQESPSPKAAPREGQVFTYIDAKGNKRVLGVAERMDWTTQAAKPAPKTAAAPKAAKPIQKPAKSAATMDQNLIAFNDIHEVKAVLRRFKKRESAINVRVLQAAGKAFKQNVLYKPHNRQSFHRYLYDKQLLRRLDDK